MALDVDNTLTLHGSQELPDPIAEWLETMRSKGLELFIISNNSRNRVAPFAGQLGLDYVYYAAKPLTIGLRRACRKFGLEKHEIMLVGDQIFTDLLAAHWFGCRSALVEPMQQEDGSLMRLKRVLERPILKRIHERAAD